MRLPIPLDSIPDETPIHIDVGSLIREAIPFTNVIDIIAEGLVAEKSIATRSQGVIHSPDWEARVKFATLRLQLGGELDAEPILPDARRVLNVFLNSQKEVKNDH